MNRFVEGMLAAKDPELGDHAIRRCIVNVFGEDAVDELGKESATGLDGVHIQKVLRLLEYTHPSG